MTALAYVARVVSLVMSLGIVIFAARIAEEMRALTLDISPGRRSWLEGDFDDPRPPRAGYFTAAFAGADASLTYYAHTTNLDVPYVFWGMWSLLTFVRAIARDEPARLRRSVLLAVLAIATKDQAYAVFGVAFPVAIAIWIAVDGVRKGFARHLGLALAWGTGLFLFADAVLFNPRGFAARLRFLTGPASRDYMEYTRDWSGRMRVLADVGRRFDTQFPKAFAILFVLGLAGAVHGAWSHSARRGARLAVALLPLLVAISFTTLFNWASLRTNARFLMPQALALAVYAGLAADWLTSGPRKPLRIVAGAGVGVLFAATLHTAVSVDANLLFDPRYDAEEWLRTHVRPGDSIETYGLNVYFPRFPPGAKVARVGPEPVDKRNPLPGVVEVQDAYERAPERGARWIVLSTAWAWRYLNANDYDRESGRRLAPTHERTAFDAPAVGWFRRLTGGQDAFYLAHAADYRLQSWFPIVPVHGTLGRSIWIYERKPGPTTPAVVP